MKNHAVKPALLSLCAGVTFSALLVSCGDKEEPKAPVVETQEVKQKTRSILETSADDELAPPPAPAAKAEKPKVARFKPAPKPKQNKSEPYILEDLSQIKLNPGDDSPKKGDTIYTYSTVPAGECGVFWVQDVNGYVMRLAVCPGNHADGEGH